MVVVVEGAVVSMRLSVVIVDGVGSVNVCLCRLNESLCLCWVMIREQAKGRWVEVRREEKVDVRMNGRETRI